MKFEIVSFARSSLFYMVSCIGVLYQSEIRIFPFDDHSSSEHNRVPTGEAFYVQFVTH